MFERTPQIMSAGKGFGNVENALRREFCCGKGKLEHTFRKMEIVGKTQIWNTLFRVAYRRISPKRLGVAALLAVVVHIIFYFSAPEAFRLFAEYVPSPPDRVELAEPENVVIPEALLPEEFRKKKKPEFVPVNPNAPEEIPNPTDNHSAVNQRAAQENPDPTTRSRKPGNDGESEDSRGIAEKVVPRELLPESARMTRVAAKQKNPEPSEKEKTKPADAGAAKPHGVALPESAAGTVAVGSLPEPEKTKAVAIPDPQERPRIAPPPGLKTLTMKSNTATNEVGAVSLDAQFSEFGEYTQRMLEAIQAAWYVTCERSSVHSRGSVVVRFTLCSDGTIKSTEILHSSASELATYACRDAIESRAPYEAWREEMVALFGEEQTTTISFYYR